MGVVTSDPLSAWLRKKTKSHSASEVTAKLHRLSGSLTQFSSEFGKFPDLSTIAAVRESTRTKLTLDDSSSNKLFRQLIAHGSKTEELFWAWSPSNNQEPDDKCSTDATALQSGECVFAYVSGLSSQGFPEAPLVMAPLMKGSTRFDRSQYNGRAYILFNSKDVGTFPIQSDGSVLIGGMDIFDPRQPFWKGKAPDIKWQE